MEATQIPALPPANLETMWSYLQETERILKESDERHKKFEQEMEKLKQETEKSNVKFNQRLGNYINLFGEVTEYEMSPKMREKFTKFGFNFPKTTRNVIIEDNINNIFLEIDAMLDDGETAVLVEIKTKLTVERINYHIERLEKMRKYADLRGEKRTFLGAVAGVIVTDDVRKYALDQGFYLIEPAGQDLNITPPYGKPKEW